MACKIIEKEGLNEKDLGYISNEIANQNIISSRYIAKLRKAFEMNERFYIFIEYCNGGDLDHLFKIK